MFGTFVDWLDNVSPPWAAYCAFISGRIIAIDKQPGVRLVDVGEMWRRLFAKIVLNVVVLEATMVCQDDQLCARLKAGIYGAIHGAQALWDGKSSTKELDFLLVDANNTFNETNRVGMLWTVRHLWLSGDHFFFNVRTLLVLWNGNGKFMELVRSEERRVVK